MLRFREILGLLLVVLSYNGWAVEINEFVVGSTLTANRSYEVFNRYGLGDDNGSTLFLHGLHLTTIEPGETFKVTKIRTAGDRLTVVNIEYDLSPGKSGDKKTGLLLLGADTLCLESPHAKISNEECNDLIRRNR